MIKRFFAVMAVCLVLSEIGLNSLSAAELSVAEPAIAKPDFTLLDICESLSKHENTTGSFVQTKTIKTNGRQLKSYGTYIICPLGIMWNTKKPFPSRLVITKQKMLQTGGDGKVTVMNGSENQIFKNISSTLSSVFSGSLNELQKNFSTELITELMTEKNEKWIVKLIPKDSTISSVMKRLELCGTFTNQREAEMTDLVIFEASGNTINYEFTEQNYPKELSADERQNFIIE